MVKIETVHLSKQEYVKLENEFTQALEAVEKLEKEIMLHPTEIFSYVAALVKAAEEDNPKDAVEPLQFLLANFLCNIQDIATSIKKLSGTE